jgi:hypothetical protein
VTRAPVSSLSLFIASSAYFFLDETFTARDAIGAALIIFGLFCVLWAQYESSRLKALEEADAPEAQGHRGSDATLDHASALSVASPQRAHRSREADAHAPLLDHAARV